MYDRWDHGPGKFHNISRMYLVGSEKTSIEYQLSVHSFNFYLSLSCLAIMAHQAHNIPWETFSSHFKFTSISAKHNGETNLFPRHKPNQGKQLDYFVKAFAKALEDFSRTERKKYPAEDEPVGPDEEVITQAVAKKIETTVEKYSESKSHCTCCYPCTCPYEIDGWTRISTWIDGHQDCHAYRGRYVHKNAMELIVALLIHKELDPLLRIASHPEVNLDRAWSQGTDAGEQLGWSRVVDSALMSYICLNVFYTKPETWDHVLRKERLESDIKADQPSIDESHRDYRSTSAYQHMLTRVIGVDSSDTHTYPHRIFYGMPWGIPHVPGPRSSRNIVCGYGSLTGHAHWPKLAGTHVPSERDANLVLYYLGCKGLPTELGLAVLRLSDYKPKARLSVPYDPLHPENGDELRKYLRYCWKLLVTSDLLAKASGTWIDWESEIRQCIQELFDDGRLAKKEYDYDMTWLQGRDLDIGHTDVRWYFL